MRCGSGQLRCAPDIDETKIKEDRARTPRDVIVSMISTPLKTNAAHEKLGSLLRFGYSVALVMAKVLPDTSLHVTRNLLTAFG